MAERDPIARLRAVLAASTPGPWEHRARANGSHCVISGGTIASTGWGEPGCEDARAIAALRNTASALLDVAEAARGVEHLAYCFGPCGRCRRCLFRAALDALDARLREECGDE